jgi:Transcription initiation factor TFIID component TAF4 family
VNALRTIVDADREFEEARLLKRQNRLAGDGTPRAASIAPGTPGSVAPEPSIKPLTKKEREKQDKGKQSVADTHAQANATTNKFLFGSKSKNKYAWMNGGTGAGSGTSTPGRLHTQGLQGTPGSLASGVTEKQMLTAEGSKKWGLHREDRKDQPLLVEMRDLQAVLENDGKEVKVLQEIYAWLETPKNRKP